MTCQAILMQRLAQMRIVLLSIGLKRNEMFTATAHTSMVVGMMASVFLLLALLFLSMQMSRIVRASRSRCMPGQITGAFG